MIREAKEEEIYQVLFDKDILPNISDEEITPEEFPLPADCKYYTVCGREVFILHDNGLVHANILPGTKDKVKKGKAFIRHVFENTDLTELSAEIPHRYDNVLKYAETCGFTIIYRDEENNYLRLEKDGFC